MTQPDWPVSLTRAVAGQVRRYREARGMSAQQLADACEKLGHPIPRTVIANLESGRRESVSLAEVLVLARALEISPVLLIFPLGTVAEVEMVPGEVLPTWQAMKWFTAENEAPVGWYSPDSTDPRFRQADTWPVPLYRRYDNASREVALQKALLRNAEEQLVETERAYMTEMVRVAALHDMPDEDVLLVERNEAEVHAAMTSNLRHEAMEQADLMRRLLANAEARLDEVRRAIEDAKLIPPQHVILGYDGAKLREQQISHVVMHG